MKPSLTDEVVFTGRNKNYGAFVLRMRYFRTFIISFILGLITFGLLVLAFVVANTNFDDEFYDFNNVVFEYADLQYIPENPPQAPKSDKPKDKEVAQSKKENLNEIKMVNDSTKLIDSSLVKEETESKGDSLNSASSGGNGSDTGIVFTRVQEIPMYPGGEDARKKFIKDNFNYAGLGQNVKIQGVVWISFIVEKDGSLTSIKVLNGVGALCDNEVINVVKKMPKWIPGKRNGLPVRVILKMPIRFENAA